MAINKKLIRFATKAKFEEKLDATPISEINDYSIVFIDDTGEIWTHGRYYGGIYGTANAQKVPLTIGGTSYDLSIDGHTHSYVPLSGASYVQSTGNSTSWGVTSGTSTGAFNAVMGTTTSATWLLSGTSGGTFRAGIQSLDSSGIMRFYVGSNYMQFDGSTLTATGFSGALVGNASSATYASAVTLTADNSTNATNYPLFVNAATGNLSPRTDTGFTYNPSTGLLTAASGAFTGNGYFNGRIYTGLKTGIADGVSGAAISNAGSIELSGAIPFIDFHFNNSVADYTSRIAETISGQLGISGKLRIGDIYTSNAADEALYVNGISTFTGAITMNGALSGATTGSFSSTLDVTGEATFHSSIQNPYDNTGIIVGNDRNLGFVKKGGYNAQITTNSATDIVFSKLNATTITTSNIINGTLTTLATLTNAGVFNAIGGLQVNGSNVWHAGNLTGTQTGHTHNYKDLANLIVLGNEHNWVPNGYSGIMWINYQDRVNRDSTALITEYEFGNGRSGYAPIRASGYNIAGYDNNYVLLAGGGQALISGLSVANAASATQVIATVTGTNTIELVRGNMADNDQFRILVGGTGSNAGYAEIATADDANEPIYVRQYSGTFTSLARTATLLDASGNTSFPGSVTASSFIGNASSATNADTVDNKHASDFATSTHSHYLPATVDVSTDDWTFFSRREYDNVLPESLTGVYNYGQLLSYGADMSAKFQLYVAHMASSGQGIRYRSGWSTDKQPWAKIWDSANFDPATKANTSGTYSGLTVGNSEYIGNDSAYMRFHWSGQGGQPTWLWGGNDPSNMYVYNPSNFSVNYANSAGSASSADSVDGLHSSNIVSGGANKKSTSLSGGNANTSNSTNASGFYYGNNTTGMPTTDWWNWITCSGNDWTGSDGYGYQLGMSFWSDDFRVRRLTSGTWQGWQTILHTGNYTNYAVSVGTAQTITASHNFNSTGLTMSSHYYHNAYDGQNHYIHMYPSGGTGTNCSISNIRFWNGAGSFITLAIAGNGAINWAGKEVWHGGNSNRSDVDWTTKILTVNGELNTKANICMMNAAGDNTIYSNGNQISLVKYDSSWITKSMLILNDAGINLVGALSSNSAITTSSYISTTNYLNAGLLRFRDNAIEDWTTATNSDIAFNYYGYQGGNSYYRSLAIYNGKSTQIAKFEGSTGNLTITGDLSAFQLTAVSIVGKNEYITVNSSDLFMQGTISGRSTRFYSGDIWCRGEFGHYKKTNIDYTATVNTDVFFHIYGNGTNTTTNRYGLNGQPIDVIVLRGASRMRAIICDCPAWHELTILNLGSVDKVIYLRPGADYYTIPAGGVLRLTSYDSWVNIGGINASCLI